MRRLGRALRRGWQGWVELLSIREPATSLARFRIAVGLVILYSLLSMIAADLVEVMWVDAAYGGLQTLDARHWLVGLLGGRTATTAWILVASGLALAGLLVAGLGGRLTVLATLQVYYGLVSAKGTLAGGYDTLITNALWILFLSECTATLSVDCRRRTGRWRSDRPVAAWPRYLRLTASIATTSSRRPIKGRLYAEGADPRHAPGAVFALDVARRYVPWEPAHAASPEAPASEEAEASGE